MQRRSPLHYRHLAAKAHMSDDEWPQPAHYGNPETEVAAIQRCALVDLSATPKWELKGKGVPQFVADELTGRAAAPAVRSAGYRSAGKGPNDYWCLTSEDRAVLMSPLPVPTHILSLHTDMTLTDLTSAYAHFVLAGSQSRGVLSRLTSLDLSALKDGACAQAAIARCHCTYIRLDMVGFSVYRLLVTRDTAEFVWDALLAAGRGVDLALAGTGAWDRICDGV